MSEHSEWNLSPLFHPNQHVWWVEERIREGVIKGINYERVTHEGMIRDNTVYFVLVGFEGSERVYEIPEGRLFDTREAALIYVENN
jgi:hypothetical protein